MLGAVPVSGLDHVQILVPPGGEGPARSFYSGVLGLREIAPPPALGPGAWFALPDGRQLHASVEVNGFVPAPRAHPCLLVEPPADLDALAGALAGAGHPVTWDDRIGGLRRFYVHDPAGNRVEFRPVG